MSGVASTLFDFYWHNVDATPNLADATPNLASGALAAGPTHFYAAGPFRLTLFLLLLYYAILIYSFDECFNAKTLERGENVQ